MKRIFTFHKMEFQKPNYKWYAVYTRVNQEKKIYKLLREKGIDCYLPLKKTLRVWNDRKVWIDEPFFRCYLFVYISYVEFFQVLNTSGVVNYVMFEGQAQHIPFQQMENIKVFIEQCEREVVVSREKIDKGQLAKVLYGPFKGMEGEVVKVCNNYRIVIKIDALGCNLYANISKDEIQKIKRPVFHSVQNKKSKYSIRS